MQVPSYNEIEAWILKITFGSIFIGVTLIFIVKILSLFFIYFASGKAITDVSGFIWKILTQLPK